MLKPFKQAFRDVIVKQVNHARACVKIVVREETRRAEGSEK